MSLTVAIASYLEPEYVKRIEGCLPGIRVLYDPSLLYTPRYHADHAGDPSFSRSPADEAKFRAMLAEADVHFDVDRRLASELPTLAPRLKWIQFTSSGIGPFLQKHGLDKAGIVITNAAGIHAVPLAEHTLLSLLYFTKDVPFLQAEQAAHKWDRYSGRELRGQTAVVVGLGGVGKEIGRLLRAVGLKVIGVKRSAGGTPSEYEVDELFTQAALPEVLPRANFLVLICPHTPETEGLIGAKEFALLPEGAVLVNIARGAVVVEEALIDALRSGRLRGAALDVAATEPMPSDNPLWDMKNVLITPHSASTVDKENERLTDLFCANIKRFASGQPLLNVFRF